MTSSTVKNKNMQWQQPTATSATKDNETQRLTMCLPSNGEYHLGLSISYLPSTDECHLGLSISYLPSADEYHLAFSICHLPSTICRPNIASPDKVGETWNLCRRWKAGCRKTDGSRASPPPVMEKQFLSPFLSETLWKRGICISIFSHTFVSSPSLYCYG